MDKIGIFDTTLRDGEQMPGVVFSYEQKLEIAEKLSDFGVNYIDIMPSISDNEKRFARQLTKKQLFPEVTASCRIKIQDIDKAIESDIKRIVLFSPVSDISIKHIKSADKNKIIEISTECIEYAKDHGLKIDFVGLDCSRAKLEYLHDIMKHIENDIEVFFYADTVGFSDPRNIYKVIKDLKKHNCKIGIHAHNDFGLATANTLAALEAGADVFSGTFTGIGERGGNAPLEEVIISLKYLYNINLDVKYEKITELCSLVEKYSGVKLQKHKPIIGEYAFTHESGIHVNGILKNPKTFEIFPPSEVGRERKFLFGKHSGKSGMKYVLEKYGENPSCSECNKLLDKVKKLSENYQRSFTEQEVFQIYRNDFVTI